MKEKRQSEQGVVALSIVLLLSVVLLTITITVTYLSIGEAQSSLSVSKGEQALAFTEGCVDDVLLKIRSNSAFNATSFTRPEGTCSVVYTTGGPVNWNIAVTSLATSYQRRIQVIFTRNPTGMSLISWKEI